MVSSSLTLAALAVDAVPNIKVCGIRSHSYNDANHFTSAVAKSNLGQVIIRIPQNDSAVADQNGENTALLALTSGVRSTLSFTIPHLLGVTKWQDYPAVVTTFIAGERFFISELEADSSIIAEIAGALRRIHQIPLDTVQNSGLPVRSALESRATTARLVERASNTRVLPVAVKNRWDQVLQNNQLWDFAPVTVHGSAADSSFIVQSDKIIGVVGFGKLAVDDPAIDFAWLAGASSGVLERALQAVYPAESELQERVIKRARFYHELELAKWLLHGFATHDQEIIADAENLLDNLVTQTAPTAAVSSVTTNRAHNPETVNEILSDADKIIYQHQNFNTTETLSSLDEGRVFTADDDFSDKTPTP
ncbi:phosphotransferase [Canibacter sp. lx-72]|nr:phosphotransferase [Canibacter zhuwentaonis]MBT1017818.1 phosphotransferase [Canibacter zhuwentaonis]